MKTFKIHLIRHGLSEGSTEGQYIGHTDVPLTDDGRHQLNEMKKEYEYPIVSAVITSPLDRCIETARILYPDLSPMIFDGLIEYDFGEFEGMTADELKDDKDFGEWLSGGEDAGVPFGESNGDFRNRVCRCFSEIVDGVIKSGIDSVAVITHGGVIMTIMQYFALPEAPMHEWLTPSGCGYTLSIMPALWGNTKKGEALAEIPLKPYEPEDELEGNWDIEIDPDEFVGFYTPEEDRT